MKIRVGNWKVDSRTLIDVEWKKWYPQLVIHEKYEKVIKWTLRVLTIVGIASSVIAFSTWYYSLIFSLILLGVEQLIERSLFQYTTMIIQPFPEFDIDYKEWVTNGFLIPIEENDQELCYMGPGYLTKEYGEKFFDYVRGWNQDNPDDTENTIILSLVIEPDERYTTYLYANTNRKILSEGFEMMQKENELKKYGKRQQQFVHQMIWWKTLDFRVGYKIKMFLERQPTKNKPFYLIPFQTEPFTPLFEKAIKKYEYKLSKREDLTKNDPEYVFDTNWKYKN